jgi:putative ABC transport system permease protein
MDALLQDLRYAFRTLAKSPGFTVVAVLTLGLGIGANAQVFTSVNALLLRPYPYRDPARLVALRAEKPSDGITANEVSYPNFVDWRAESRSFEGLAAHSGRTVNVAGGDEPELVRGEQISAGTFRLLGVARASAVIFWKRRTDPARHASCSFRTGCGSGDSAVIDGSSAG